MSNEFYLKMATEIAINAIDYDACYRKNHNFGVVAIRKDGSIAMSNNILTQNPHPAAHAEKRILAKAGFGATLYLVRVKRDNSWGLAKPCKHCQTLIKNKKVEKVVYSVDNNQYCIWYPLRKVIDYD
jgi:tRNA(Arg) A34 adenosine deaminase TadA